MMEFFLSKFWLFVCGAAVTAVLVLSFAGLNDSVSGSEMQSSVDDMAQVIGQAASSNDDVTITVPVADYLPEGENSMELGDGSLWLLSGGVRYAADLPANITVIGPQGQAVSGIVALNANDVLTVATRHQWSASSTVIQVANVHATSSTD